MLDLFAQLFHHCWGLARALHMISKSYGLDPSHDALQVPSLLGVIASVCTLLPNNAVVVGQTMLRVVAFICT